MDDTVRDMHRRVIHAGFASIAAGIFAACLMLSGCGPIEYIATVPLDAAGAYGEAKHVKQQLWREAAHRYPSLHRRPPCASRPPLVGNPSIFCKKWP